jgi:hypothetical protein
LAAQTWASEGGDRRSPDPSQKPPLQVNPKHSGPQSLSLPQFDSSGALGKYGSTDEMQLVQL